ncbi:MAG: DUF1800 domain-containing protein [Phycisphaerales bacterium]|nr:DUF1800 domain-containing protein [Phycisphaerales bacterium]
MTHSAPITRPVAPGLDRLPDGEFGFDQARHLLWRAGFGGTPRQVQTLVEWGLERSVDYLLNPEGVKLEDAAPTFDRDIMRPATEEERLAYRRAQQSQDEDAVARFRLERQRRERQDREQIREMQKWWLGRMIESPRPLEEKMTLFWHGHFAASYRKIEDSFDMFAQNEMFRRHALGNFGDLLRGIIRDPAMLRYLDNDRSSVRRPNENLARELMELFSLGEGNYEEQDIKEGARALTGYTFADNEFVFEDRNHDKGSKNILGRSGRMNGEDFCDAILGRKACAGFIATKLYRFFVGDVALTLDGASPEARSAISQLAGTLQSSNYELKPALRRLFMSAHFHHPSIVGELIKSPAELVVGAARSLLTPTRDLSVLSDAMDLMGQSLFFPPSVKGWDGGRSWINTSTLYIRQNILTYMLTGRMPRGFDRSLNTQKFDAEPILGELAAGDPSGASDPTRVIDYLLRFALGRAPDSARDALLAFVREAGGRLTGDVITGLLVLVTAMPEYQLC